MNIRNKNISTMMRGVPTAVALIRGSDEFPEIKGSLKLYQLSYGVLAVAEIEGLPVATKDCEESIFAFHIHGGTSCTGNQNDPFADAGTHYNPNNCPHPYHAGDLPPLFGTKNGTAFLSFISDRITVDEAIGKTVIIHDMPDDFTTQPSGNSGKKIACGHIMSTRRKNFKG